jgi:tripartite-type tricarboxylate transporter receptor subunit TctC
MNIALSSLAACLTLTVGAGAAIAQTFPTKPIRFVISVAPGTVIDAVARPVGDELGKQLAQPVILEHRPGGNQTIAARSVVTADPDGHTL